MRGARLVGNHAWFLRGDTPPGLKPGGFSGRIPSNMPCVRGIYPVYTGILANNRDRMSIPANGTPHGKTVGFSVIREFKLFSPERLAWCPHVLPG
jgi:hypothetical protein